MRGEHLQRYIDAIDFEGSSPHARGAQAVSNFFTNAVRIIPACAGSTPG